MNKMKNVLKINSTTLETKKKENTLIHKLINFDMNKNKKRNYGIDLVRLIAMYGVVLDHLLYIHGGMTKYHKYIKYLKLMHITIGWHNDGFILISGIVGYKSYKYSNLLYLWLCVFFYSVGINLYFRFFRKINSNIEIEYFPIIYKRYWFFTTYFGMYLFLPIITKGISILTKFEFTSVVISTIGILVVWGDIKNPDKNVFGLSYGMTVIWFLIFYITGAFIGKYRIDYSGSKKYAFCLLCILIYIFSCYLFYKVYHNELYLGNGDLPKKIVILLKQLLTDNYAGISKITNSIVVTLFFMQLHYNKYISKIISVVAPLTFGVYLIHENNIIKNNILRYTFNKDPYNISLRSAMSLVYLRALKIFIICIIIDFFRNLLFNLLRIRKICIFFENKLKAIYS